MSEPSAVPRARAYAPRVLFIGAGGGLILVGLAQLLLQGLEAVAGTPPDPVAHAVVLVATLLTVAGQVLGAWLRMGRGPERVAWTVPMIARVVPPFVVAGLVFLAHKFETIAGLADFTIPVLAAAYTPALAIAPLQYALLRGIGVRVRPESLPDRVHVESPPSLARAYGMVLGDIGFASAVFALALLHQHGAASPVLVSDARGLLALISVAVCAITSVLAGRFLGAGPGGALRSMARRLDALGYDSRNPVAFPVRVTSFDQLGLLFFEIERLRGRLANEVELYQRALDRTRAAESAKAEFLAAVSHELRTPLNAVGGYAQLLLEGGAGPLTEPQAEDVRLIRAGGQQLLSLINDILDVSMIESGELRLSFTDYELPELIEEIVRIHRPQVRERGLVMRTEIEPLPPIRGDRRRVSQVVTNLLSNAIKFTEQGTITLRAYHSPEQNRVIVEVEDTGIGIAESDLETIFEEYRQVGATKRRIKGTGLGLAIAQSIVVHHGGKLWVRSTPAVGSTFTMELPLTPQRAPSDVRLVWSGADPADSDAGTLPAPTAPNAWQGWEDSAP